MYHYMAALYKWFFQVPDFTELEEEIEQTRQEVRDYLGQPERRKLMQLVDAQNLLREKISLASFIAGFKLAQEIAKGGTPWQKNELMERATSGNGRMAAGKDGTRLGTIPRPENGSSRMCWVRPRERSRKS